MIGEITLVTGGVWRAVRSPETVTISTAPATIATTGCNVIVTATPVSDAKYFDKVIWKQMNASAERNKSNRSKKQKTQQRGHPRPFETQALPE